jgi:hypothetical protein
MADVMNYNKKSAELKQLMKQNELEEDKKILEYILEKERKEEAKEKELALKKGEREKELARLHNAQQRVIIFYLHINIRYL